MPPDQLCPLMQRGLMELDRTWSSYGRQTGYTKELLAWIDS